MKITEERLKKLGFKEFTCEDGIVAYKKNNFIWFNEGMFGYDKHGESYLLCDDVDYPINSIGRLNALYKAITGL